MFLVIILQLIKIIIINYYLNFVRILMAQKCLIRKRSVKFSRLETRALFPFLRTPPLQINLFFFKKFYLIYYLFFLSLFIFLYFLIKFFSLSLLEEIRKRSVNCIFDVQYINLESIGH